MYRANHGTEWWSMRAYFIVQTAGLSLGHHLQITKCKIPSSFVIARPTHNVNILLLCTIHFLRVIVRIWMVQPDLSCFRRSLICSAHDHIMLIRRVVYKLQAVFWWVFIDVHTNKLFFNIPFIHLRLRNGIFNSPAPSEQLPWHADSSYVKWYWLVGQSHDFSYSNWHMTDRRDMWNILKIRCFEGAFVF